MLSTGLYVAYVMIFGISTGILFKRGKTLHKYNLVANTVIFIAASLTFAFDTLRDINDLESYSGRDVSTIVYEDTSGRSPFSEMIGVLSSLIADIIL
ncbi:hypothetical protein VNI00_014603, partial [Paramarasmius palmivorus]